MGCLESAFPKAGGLVGQRSKSMPQLVFRDAASKGDTGDAGEVVVQACPKARINDLVTEVSQRVELTNGVQVASRAGGSSAPFGC